MNARSRLNLTRLTWPMLCAAACLASTAPAVAGDADTGAVPRVTVYYGDLNLQKSESVATLYRRIERAAKRVCARPNAGDLRQIQAARQCAREAIDRAVVTVDMPALAQYAMRTRTRALVSG